MKKIIAIFFALMLTLSLSLTAFAAEEEEMDTPATENATEGENGGSADIPEAEEESKFYSDWIDSITSSALWASIGAYVLAGLGIIGFVSKKFGSIAELIRAKADTATLKAALKDGLAEMRERFDEEYEKINDELAMHQEKEKQMWAMLTIFMTHAKIPAAAKAEIMNCITGLKDMSGDLEKIVEEAQEAIKKAEADNAANAAPTPALDAIVGEKEITNYVELG